MYAGIVALALFGCAAAAPSLLAAPGILAAPGVLAVAAADDGQWRPQLDGSAWGSGAIQWGLEDGSWKPALDGSVLGSGDLTWLSRRKRSLGVINPNALNVPLDDAVTAWAKNAQLIQQQTEGTRNILGGGIPLALPADTLEVAIGKQAHAIAHANQRIATASGIAGPVVGAAGIAAVSRAVVAAHSLVAPGVVAAGPLGIAGIPNIAGIPSIAGIPGIIGAHGIIG